MCQAGLVTLLSIMPLLTRSLPRRGTLLTSSFGPPWTLAGVFSKCNAQVTLPALNNLTGVVNLTRWASTSAPPRPRIALFFPGEAPHSDIPTTNFPLTHSQVKVYSVLVWQRPGFKLFLVLVNRSLKKWTIFSPFHCPI